MISLILRIIIFLSIEEENSTWAKYFLLGNILHLSCCYSIISKFQNLLNMDPFVNAVGGFFVFNFSDLLGRILAGIAKWPKASRWNNDLLVMKFVLLESFPTKRVVVVVVVLVVVAVFVVIVVILYLKIRGGSWVTLVSSIIRLVFIPLFMVWIKKN